MRQQLLRNFIGTGLGLLFLAGCGGGTPNQMQISVPATVSGSTTVGWKINWGQGQPSILTYDTTKAVWVESAWSILAVFGPLDANEVRSTALAETRTTPILIDEGPNKGKPTYYQWKGTTIAYDPAYHPLTAAVCKTTAGAWAGFGATGDWAVYVDADGQGRILQGHTLYQSGKKAGDPQVGLPGMYVASSSSVSGMGAGNSSVAEGCGASPVWYTSYYDRGGNGPGTVAY